MTNEIQSQRELELEADLELLKIELAEAEVNNLLVLKMILMQCGGDVTIPPEVIGMLDSADETMIVHKTLDDNSLWIYLVSNQDAGGLEG